ncbi:MAG: prepilin-type N-terminal cleavage/methylation domain-containing protein [Bacilli bacterium]|nr:prepilin-type N-terminal cleavage/methylation domain-containing protein [Bacilli bacterium]
MKKGFTLIELLAVIVILAIIALIAFPTISGIVERSRKGSAEQSANGYNDAVNKQMALNLMDSNEENDINIGVYDAPLDSYNVKVKGNKPKSGWVEVTKNGVNRYSLVIGDYVVSYDGETTTVGKGRPIARKPKPVGNTIIYRYSNDHLYLGDKIDLDNRTYTNYTKYDFESGTNISANDTYEMSGIYSTDLNDVLSISTNYAGYPIESKSNPVYLKHTVNSEGIIIKSESCLKTSWGTLCQTGGEGTYDDVNKKWNDTKYETKKTNLLDFFNWNSENNTSTYDGYTCQLATKYTTCESSLLQVGVTPIGAIYSNDLSVDVACIVDEDSRSLCN